MGKKVKNKIQKIISNKSNENVIISSKAKKKKKVEAQLLVNTMLLEKN